MKLESQLERPDIVLDASKDISVLVLLPKLSVMINPLPTKVKS